MAKYGNQLMTNLKLLLLRFLQEWKFLQLSFLEFFGQEQTKLKTSSLFIKQKQNSKALKKLHQRKN